MNYVIKYVYGGEFMVIPYSKFYGKVLKKLVLEAEDFTYDDILTYKFLCNAYRNFPNDVDENKFKEYIEATFELPDQVCFYILVSKLGNTLFEKDIYYISELCTSLTIKEVSPQHYLPYARFFLNEPIYSLIININENVYQHDYLSIFGAIITYFNITDLSESDYNRIIKLLKKMLNQEYLVLFQHSSTLEDIYITLYKKMLEINKNGFPFTQADFITVQTLKKYLATNDPELINALKERLLASENNAFDALNIIRSCLKIIKKYNEKIIPLELSRRKHYEKK